MGILTENENYRWKKALPAFDCLELTECEKELGNGQVLFHVSDEGKKNCAVLFLFSVEQVAGIAKSGNNVALFIQFVIDVASP